MSFFVISDSWVAAEEYWKKFMSLKSVCDSEEKKCFLNIIFFFWTVFAVYTISSIFFYNDEIMSDSDDRWLFFLTQHTSFYILSDSVTALWMFY